MKDRYIFPAVFDYDKDGISITFPDLPGCISCGKTDEEALSMAKDALGGHLFCLEEENYNIPEPTSALKIKHADNQVIVLIDIWMPPVRESINNKAINKTVTIPQWLLTEAKAADINFSQTLQDALMERLGIHREIKRRKSRKNQTVPAAAD